jgi:hypothetical protein
MVAHRPDVGDTREVPTFPKGHYAAQLHVEHAKLLAQLALETGGNVQEERERRRRLRMQGSPADLRGIPAIGRGVGGAVAGSRPGHGRLFR